MENPNPYHQPNTPPNPFFQQQQQPGNHKIGVSYGLGMIIGGAVISGINLIILFASNYYFPKFFVVGIALVLMGPVFMIFPGRPVAQKPERKEMGKELWRNSSGFHKTIWLTWAAASIAGAFFILHSFGLGPFN